MRLKRTFFASLLAIPALLLTTNTANAAAVTGVANIAGNVTVFDGVIQFAPTFGTGAPGTQETGAFTGLTGGTIMSLSGGPTTGAVNVPSFATFTTGLATPVNFDLTFIAAGTGTAAGCGSSALGASCTPTGSPFTLFQLGNNTVVISLTFTGSSYTGTSATGSSPTVAAFSTQLAAPGTIPEIIAILQSGGSITSTYSAQFVATPGPAVPEPATIMLMGMGLIGAGLVARRKIRS